MNAPIRLPSPAIVSRAFTLPLSVIPSQYGTKVRDADGQLLMTMAGIDLEHEERARLVVALITAAAEAAPSFAHLTSPHGA